jgi:endonuclease YncB( thermonuclease family)
MPIALMVSWFLLLCFPLSGRAADISNVKVLSCYDGDTCRVNLPRSAFNDDWAYQLFGHNIPIRVEGIDTPEIRGKCQKEKDLAYTARDFVRQVLSQSQTIDLKDAERGKYFRIVARVIVDGQDISKMLIEKQLAVSYDGGTKTKDWCE